MRTAFITLIGSTFALSVASAQSPARTLGVADYLDLQSVASPQISPDGKSVVYARGQITAYSQYNGLGQPQRIDYPNGTTRTATYDALGRLIGVDEPFDVSLTFGYDADGNRISVEDSTGAGTCCSGS